MMMRACTIVIVAAALGRAAAPPVEFNRDIRPIFSDKCFKCHGPDARNRQANLRFDNEEGAKPAIAPGDPEHSKLIARVTADQARRMPPVFSGLSLTAREIELLRDWVAQGAKWRKHWSFIAPQRPPIPAVAHRDWPRNPIDSFVLARLEREGLAHAPEADRRRLIRRVTLDLTGLPPTPAEVEAFLRDTTPEAYERVVDRLLQSPAYGERMAAVWLDAARYADTNGYQTDAERFMWRWRDWVIDAFNRNLAYDRFTVEQIAGDLLPHATLDQIIATGFNRNHRGNGEGGIIPEEYAVEYVVDRVETTSTVWLGLSFGCARCHDHKYDPYTQKEFYRVFAYFNNIPERGKANKYGNSPPMVPAPLPAQQAELAALDKRLAGAESAFAALLPAIATAQRSWEQSLHGPQEWSISSDLVAHFEKPVADAGDIADFGFYDKFTLAARINPSAATGAIVTRTQPVPEGEGFGLYLKDGKVQLNLVKRWLDDSLRVETEAPVVLNKWQHVLATYDGSRTADGVRLYIDGRPQKVRVVLDELNQSFQVKEPLRIGAGGSVENAFRGEIADIRLYREALSPAEAAVVATPESIAQIAALTPSARSSAQSDKLAWCFLDQHAPSEHRHAWQVLHDVRRERRRLVESFTTVMVMQERPTPRETHVLMRGAYDKPGDVVTPGVPAVLPPLPEGAPNNRFGFARWLVDPANPLTARVAVNRFWQMYFGIGLVKTVEDFGSQGEWPSNPELLDWLATEFIRTGWDMKALQKTIVLSATYRQSSVASPELIERDPENRLLARGPRLRLPAGMVRDQALAIAGVLVPKIGGPSVKPYQPAGIWKELSGEDYQPDHGENLYRRSLYTFWKRTIPPPTMVNFDAAARETCVVRETRTNTPLQALDLMNDVTYLEAARLLGTRMLREGGRTSAERIAWAFERATARPPAAAEREILQHGFSRYYDRYRTDPAAAETYLKQGESLRDPALDTSELAAYTAVASLILNLDETITKE